MRDSPSGIEASSGFSAPGSDSPEQPAGSCGTSSGDSRHPTTFQRSGRPGFLRLRAGPVRATHLSLGLLKTHHHSPAAADAHSPGKDEVLASRTTGISNHGSGGDSPIPNSGVALFSSAKRHTILRLSIHTCAQLPSRNRRQDLGRRQVLANRCSTIWASA